MKYEKKIEELLLKLPHKLQVKYALACAESVFHLVEDKYKEVIRKSLDTTALWLIDKASADEVYSAASASAYATSASATAAAASASYVASAAYSAAYATYAYYAASASAFSANKDLKYYYEELIRMIKDLTELDKLIYDINDLKLGENK